MRAGDVAESSRRAIVADSRASRAPWSRPNTVRRITSSVMRWKNGWRGIARTKGAAEASAVAAHRGRVGVHALAVTRGQEELALAQMRPAVEEQERAVADEAAQEHAVGLARVEDLGVAREPLADRLGRRQHHVVARADEPQREHVSVAPLAPAEQAQRRGQPQRGLRRARQRQRGGEHPGL